MTAGAYPVGGPLFKSPDLTILRPSLGFFFVFFCLASLGIYHFLTNNLSVKVMAFVIGFTYFRLGVHMGTSSI